MTSRVRTPTGSSTPISRCSPATWSGTQGEPVALVAADHPEIARLAASKIVVDYEVLEPVTDPVAALEPAAPRLHPGGNLVRHLKIRKGDPAPAADVVVTGSYQIGMQDQAFLGPEAGLAVPDGAGGVELFVSTQWLHVDQQQICAALGLPPERVRLVLAGVGGAFGGREDLSMHVHACLLALHTGKPVKMMYSREESFFGHVHRHPALIRYEHGANRDGTLVYVHVGDLPRRRRVRVEHDGRRRQRRDDGRRALRRAERAHRRLRRLHQQPAVRRDARLRVGAGGVRLRGADGQAGRGPGNGSGRVPLPERDGAGQRRPDRPGHRQPGAGRRAAAAGQRDAAAAAACGGRVRRRPGPAAAARRGRQHHARRGHRPRDRLRRRLQERRLLRGLRRLLDRPGQARGRRRRAGRDRAHRGRRGRPGTGHDRAADLPDRARRRQRGDRPEGHRASARPDPPPRRGRPTSPAARSRPPASSSASACSRWSRGTARRPAGTGLRLADGQVWSVRRVAGADRRRSSART